MLLERLPNLVEQLREILTRFFPQFEILFRTDGKINHIKIPRNMQFAIIGGVFIAFGWTIFSSFSFVINNEVVLTKNKEIIKARMAYRGLLSEVNEYQDKFSNLTEDLSKNHGLMLNLVEKNATLQQNVKSAENKLETTKSRNKRIIQARTNLKEKLGKIQIELNSLNNHNFSLKGNLSTVTTDLESALSERNSARNLGEKLSKEVVKLQNDLEDLNASKNMILIKLTENTKENIKDIRYVLKRTGINYRLLVAEKSKGRNSKMGKGGPFVPIKSIKNQKQNLKNVIYNLDSHLRELQQLQKLMKRLPISSPLNYHTISSHYGKRRDPINKRWAMHTGLDFGGVKNSRVYATAPGKVTFAGRNGKYGKLVEIDHGLGFKTRYGHLNKILIKRGQRVNNRANIGLLGSTGRSTGPHLHYEILVKGKHQNPWRFIKAGRYVYKR